MLLMFLAIYGNKFSGLFLFLVLTCNLVEFVLSKPMQIFYPSY